MRRGWAGRIVFALFAGLLIGMVARAEDEDPTPDPLPDDRPDVTLEAKADTTPAASRSTARPCAPRARSARAI